MVFNPNFKPDTLHSGVLLIATPALKDPNFEKSVILLSAHEKEEGALGVVINKPLQRTLGEYVDDFKHSPLANVKIFLGGPVQQNHLILAGWQWSESYQNFQLHFGISQEKAEELLKEGGPNVEIRGYLGYAGWSEGQLENEIQQQAWYQSPIDPVSILENPGPVALWQKMVGQFGSELDGIVDVPEDPSLN